MAMVNTNTAADLNKYYDGFFKAQKKEETAFQAQVRKDMGVYLISNTQTIIEDTNNNGIYGDRGADANLNGKKDRKEKPVDGQKKWTPADKPVRQYTTYEIHVKMISSKPEIVSYLKKNGYEVFSIDRDASGKPVKFHFVKADQKVALQKDIKDTQKTEDKVRYAKAAQPKPSDQGVSSNGSGVHGTHPVNKHMRKQPTVAKNDKTDPKPAQEPKVKPDSKRQPGSNESVKNDDSGTIKVGDYKTDRRTAPELAPVTKDEFKKLTKEENIPANDMNIERALVYRPSNDPKISLAWGDQHNDSRMNDVVQYGGTHGYKVYKFDIKGEEVYLFVK